MAKEQRCPKCNKVITVSPLKRWKFRDYDVTRYQCGACGAKFNTYRGPKTSFIVDR